LADPPALRERLGRGGRSSTKIARLWMRSRNSFGRDSRTSSASWIKCSRVTMSPCSSIFTGCVKNKALLSRACCALQTRGTDQNAVYLSFTVFVAFLAMLGKMFQETIPPSTFVKVPTKFALGVHGFGPDEVLIAQPWWLKVFGPLT